jgi:hypothetical protein
MALPINDALINATTELLTTYSANWSFGLGTYNASSLGGQAGGSAASIAYDNSNTYTNNQYAQCQLNSTGSNVNGVAVRAASGGNAYVFRASVTAGSYMVGKFVAGTGTNLSGNIAQTFSVGDALLLTVVGTTLTAYQNGVQLYTTTDSSLTAGAAGVSGAGIGGGGTSITSWQGGDMPRVLTLVAAVGTYAYVGEAVNLQLPNNYLLLCQPGIYFYEGGQTSNSYGLEAAGGIYVYTGGAATLTETTTINNYALACAAGIYDYLGGLAALNYTPVVYPGTGGQPSPCRVIIPAKRASEVVAPAFDFTSKAQPGETITSTKIIISVWSGNDTNPGLMYGGSTAINGLVASPKIVRGVVGCIYVIQVIATGSISGPMELDGLLAVLPTGI